MKLLLVDETYAEVSAIPGLCKSIGWDCDLAFTITQALQFLTKDENHYDYLIIDIMVPWGEGFRDAIDESFSKKQAGVWLIRAIRDIADTDYHRFLEFWDPQNGVLKPIPSELKLVPILALSKVADDHRDVLSEYPTVKVMDKLYFDTRWFMKKLSEIKSVYE